MPAPNYFPSTLKTAIVDWLHHRDRATLNHHVLSGYYEPIRLYLKGSRWYAARLEKAGRRGRRDPKESEDLNELVNGFFTDLLERDDFFDRWLASGRRLGRYLRAALWFYLQGLYRDQVREMEAAERICHSQVEEEPPERDPERDIDKAFVTQLVAHAMEEARVACEQNGLGAHWHALVRHLYDGASYPDVARELNVRPDRAVVMVRTAASHFERAFRALVSQQVRTPEHVRRAIASFLQVMES